MRSIFKYPLEITGEQTVLIPEGYKLLAVQNQKNVVGSGLDTVCLWADVDPASDVRLLRVFIYGTGQKVEGFNGQYFGTVQRHGFVWHVYTSE